MSPHFRSQRQVCDAGDLEGERTNLCYKKTRNPEEPVLEILNHVWTFLVYFVYILFYMYVYLFIDHHNFICMFSFLLQFRSRSDHIRK